MATTIATVHGTALRPGVSKNRRYYPPEVIERAVARAAARLADPDGRPITMRTAHPNPELAAWAPVTEIAGAVTGLTRAADGSMTFQAQLSGNRAGKDVLALVDTRGKAKPFLKNVSIRGHWVGDVRTVQVDGVPCETADDLEIDGLDFTHLPGVDGAQIDRVLGPGANESAAVRAAYVTESVEEALVTATQETTSAPAGEVAPVVQTWADPGYLPDKTARYPLESRAQVKAAWRAVTEADTARQYTSAQLKRTKGRIKRAAGQHGVRITQEGWLVDVTPLTESAVAEMWCDDNARPSFSVNVDNGTVQVSVSSYRIDAHDLDRVARQAMAGAVDALASLDPDGDGEFGITTHEGAMPDGFKKFVKKKGDDDEDDDETEGSEESAAEHASVPSTPHKPAGQKPPKLKKPNEEDENECGEAATETKATGTAASTTTTESEAPAMTAETTNTPASAPAGGTITLSESALSEMLAKAASSAVEAVEAKRAAKKAKKAEKAPVAETATPPAEGAPATESAVAETEDQRIARLVKAGITEALQAKVATGAVPPFRKGVVGKVNEATGTVTGLGSGDAELNEHGLPKSWAGESAPHELKGAARAGLSATLTQHVIGHRI